MNEDDLKSIELRRKRTELEIAEELVRIQSFGQSLTPQDEAFVRARRSMLTTEQKQLWSDILSQKAKKVEQKNTKVEPSQQGSQITQEVKKIADK